MVKKNADNRQIEIGNVEDQTAHVLGYLFAILLPFYRQDLSNYWDLISMIVALSIIVFLFVYLNLYYLNLWFAFFGYRAFLIWSPTDDNKHTGQEPLIIITNRRYLTSPNSLYAYRLGDTVYLESKT